MSSRSWSEFRINFSQNTAWDLSREHWWDLINFESILFLSSLILCLSKTVKYLACPSKWRVELTVWEVLFFSLTDEMAYYFFNFLFNILELYKFALWVSQLGNKDLVSDYIFTSQRESHSIPDMAFWLTLNYHSGHTPHPSSFLQGRGGWASNHIFIKNLLDRTSTFRGGCWEKGDEFNQAGVVIFI